MVVVQSDADADAAAGVGGTRPSVLMAKAREARTILMMRGIVGNWKYCNAIVPNLCLIMFVPSCLIVAG